MQPSGKLHLGNYFGALKNWVEFQDDFACFFFLADWHALSSLYAAPRRIREFSFEVAVDWLRKRRRVSFGIRGVLRGSNDRPSMMAARVSRPSFS